MRAEPANPDPAELALRALGWTLEEPSRAQRFLSVTGLEPDDLRERAGTRAVLAAVLAFLEAHQPDLLAAADALAVRPEQLVAAHAELAR
jgi:hypothetical protein